MATIIQLALELILSIAVATVVKCVVALVK